MSCLSQQPGPEEKDYILMAQLFNTRNLSNVLKAIHFKEVITVKDVYDQEPLYPKSHRYYRLMLIMKTDYQAHQSVIGIDLILRQLIIDLCK